MSLVYLQNGMGADVAAWNKRGGDGGDGRGTEAGEVMKFCSKIHREPWKALEKGRDGV